MKFLSHVPNAHKVLSEVSNILTHPFLFQIAVQQCFKSLCLRLLKETVSCKMR